MELETIKVRKRVRKGTGGSREVRREGDVPAIIYGGDSDPVNIRIDLRQITHLIHGELGEHALVQIEVEDDPSAGSAAQLKDIQHHPVRGTIVHADFQRIELDKPIEAIVPIVCVGRAAGVIEGGILDHQLREMTVKCLPLDVPAKFEVDVTSLELGQNLHVSDVTPPENVEILTPDRYAIATVLQSRLTRIADSAAGAAGARAEAEAEGDDDADGGDDE